MILAALTVPGTSGTVCLIPVGKEFEVRSGSLHNRTSSAITVTLTVSTDQHDQARLMTDYSLAAKDTLSLNDYLVGTVLDSGDHIDVDVSTGNALDVLLSGVWRP